MVLLSGSTGQAGDSLVAVKEIRDEQVSSGLLPPGSKVVLYQAVENAEQEEEQDGAMSFDLEAEASREDILILRPVDLLRLLDRSDRGEEGGLFALLAGTAGR